jgi:hypothetical protein
VKILKKSLRSIWTTSAHAKYRSDVAATDDPKKKDFFATAKQMGYRLRKPGHYAKFNGLAHEETLLRLRELAKAGGYQLQDVYTQAFELWIEQCDAESRKTGKG